MAGDAGERQGAQRALAELKRLVLDATDVTLVDLGLAPGASERDEGEVVLRIHVRRFSPADRDRFPTELGGYRVVVLPGDYRLEQ
jgi:hypothetical protein